MKTGRPQAHGQCPRKGKRTPEWTTWNHMKRRCTNPNYIHYKNYGGRGIKICERWLNSFQNFFEDMGPKPSNKHSLDRIRVNEDYSPDNCRWATEEEQQSNRTDNIWIEFNGERKTLSEWSIITGIPKTTISGRVRRGLPADQILKLKTTK